jgi:hypothetical protein
MGRQYGLVLMVLGPSSPQPIQRIRYNGRVNGEIFGMAKGGN